MSKFITKSTSATSDSSQYSCLIENTGETQGEKATLKASLTQSSCAVVWKVRKRFSIDQHLLSRCKIKRSSIKILKIFFFGKDIVCL